MRHHLSLFLLCMFFSLSFCNAQLQERPCHIYSDQAIEKAFLHFDPSQGEAWGDSIWFMFEVIDSSLLEPLSQWAKENEFRYRFTPINSLKYEDRRTVQQVTLFHKGITGDKAQISWTYNEVRRIKEKLNITDCGLAKVNMRWDHPARKRYREEAPCPK
jgi:hypothetical protein